MASTQSRFEQHELVFDDAIGVLSQCVSDVKFVGGEERVDLLRTANRKLQEATGALRSMEAEMGAMGPNKRRTANLKITQGKTDLASQKRALDAIVAKSGQGGAAGGGSGMSKEQQEQRTKLLGIEHSSNAATSHLQFARSTLADTEDMGVATLADLEGQGRQLRDVRDRVHEVNSLADMGRNILNNMEVTAMKNQLLLWLAIIVLLGCLGAVVYFGFIKDPKH